MTAKGVTNCRAGRGNGHSFWPALGPVMNGNV